MGNAVRVQSLDLGDVTDTGARVRAAAVYLFATKGYAAASIRDIAREVGITNAGVYHFVANKETLLIDLMREGQRSLMDLTEAALAQVERPEDRLATLISGLVGAHVVNRMVSLVTDGEIRALTPGTEGHDEIVAMRDAYELRWREALRDGVEQGVFTVADQRLSRLALLSMCTGVSQWHDPNGSAALEDIAAHFVGVGLAAVHAQRDGQPLTVADVTSLDPTAIPRLPWEPRVITARAERTGS